MLRTILSILAAFGLFTAAAANAEETLKLSVNSNWAPYSATQKGVSDGILPALVREIVETRMGVKLVTHGYPWGRAQKLVENGNLDALVTVPTDARLKFAERSEGTVYKFEMRAAVKSDSTAHNKLAASTTIDTVKHLRVCDILGNGWAERFYERHNIAFYAASNVSTCLRMIDNGRMDVLIQPYAVALHEIKKAGLENKLTVLQEPFGGMAFTLLVSKKSKHGGAFMKRFDATLDAMKKDGSYDRIVERLRKGQ